MNLTEALGNYAGLYLNESNDWYCWRKLNLSKLPQGIHIDSKLNQYHQNLSLKDKLSQKFSVSDSLQKVELTRYYVSTWGGIHGNNKEKIKCYALSKAADLINNESSGIASWSKALSMRDHKKYAIYDARVAFSLNLLQIASNVLRPVLYPLLPSRNTCADKWKSLILKHAVKSCWDKASPSNFYTDYINILTNSSKKLECFITTLEMLLFAKPQDLYNKASMMK